MSNQSKYTDLSLTLNLYDLDLAHLCFQTWLKTWRTLSSIHKSTQELVEIKQHWLVVKQSVKQNLTALSCPSKNVYKNSLDWTLRYHQPTNHAPITHTHKPLIQTPFHSKQQSFLKHSMELYFTCWVALDPGKSIVKYDWTNIHMTWVKFHDKSLKRMPAKNTDIFSVRSLSLT